MDPLSKLNSLFLQDPYLDEVDFLPILDSLEYICTDHKLGIPYPLAVKLYGIAHAQFALERRRNLVMRDEFECPGDDEGNIEQKKKEELFEITCARQKMFELTRALVLINAANLTAWNTRKVMLCVESLAKAQCLDAAALLKEELRFVSLVLTRHPKTSEVWAHR